MQPSSSKEKRAAGGELVIPVAAVIFTLYYFSTIVDSPWTAQVSAFFVGAILLALSVAFIVKTAFAVCRGDASLDMSRLYSRRDISTGRIALMVLTFGYIVVIDYAGFTITTFLFLFLSMLVLNKGGRIGLIAALSGAMALGGYALFILSFDTRFPRGPFEVLMKGMLGDGG